MGGIQSEFDFKKIFDNMLHVVSIGQMVIKINRCVLLSLSEKRNVIISGRNRSFSYK